MDFEPPLDRAPASRTPGYPKREFGRTKRPDGTQDIGEYNYVEPGATHGSRCVVTIHADPMAEEWARRCYFALQYGDLRPCRASEKPEASGLIGLQSRP